MPPGRRAVLALSVVVACWLAAPAVSQDRSTGILRVRVEPGVVVVLGDELAFEVLPERSEGLLAFTERVCGDRSRADTVAAANGGDRSLDLGARYRVPWSCARESLRRRGVEALFPGDRRTGEAWLHEVSAPRSGVTETLWGIALWFTGSGEAYRQIRDFNGLPDEDIEPGQRIRIPRRLLRPDLLALMPAAPVSSQRVVRTATTVAESGPPAKGSSGPLRYGTDERGTYAGYRLRAGEALYSSVVVRFTGRLLAEDVNPLAHLIARRSGISDLTDIPVGYEIRIPLEYLSAEFLPPDDPRRLEYEQQRSESARYSNTVRSADLRGVTVILDAGHGGKDVGSASGGIWESIYVYDVMERVRRQLRQRTAARVVTTTRDGPAEYRIPERDVLPHSRDHVVLTDPPYPNNDSRISANLRWALSNAMLARLETEGTDPSNVVFLSIHADWLHPSVRGAMSYVPGLLPLRSNYRLTSDVYRRRTESRYHGEVDFTHRERVRSLGLSQELANHTIAAIGRRDLRIHSNQPIRDRIYRGRRPWVPAVLKYNRVPAKILVEVCNLANAEDLELIKTQNFREEMAGALVDGILAYYETGGETRTAASGR